MKKKKEVVFHDIWSILCCQFVSFQGKGKEIPRQNIDSNDLKEPHIFFLENIFNILVMLRLIRQFESSIIPSS